MKDPDGALLEKLRAAGAKISGRAGDLLEAALKNAARSQVAHQTSPRDACPPDDPPAAERSTVRRIKSKVEQRFAAHLDRLVAEGQIERWRYEADRFQLADHNEMQRTYTPDFTAYLKNARRRYYEVKGNRRFESDQDTRTVFIWARQQFADANHEFIACRETATHGRFLQIWNLEQINNE